MVVGDAGLVPGDFRRPVVNPFGDGWRPLAELRARTVKIHQTGAMGLLDGKAVVVNDVDGDEAEKVTAAIHESGGTAGELAVKEPVLTRDHWDVEDIARAFDEELRDAVDPPSRERWWVRP